MRTNLPGALLTLILPSLIISAPSFSQTLVTQEWVQTYNGPASGADGGKDIAVDSAGNAVVAASSKGMGTAMDFFLIKYSPEGDTLWTRRYNGSGNGNDLVRALEMDEAGNIYVTGVSMNANGNYDALTLKYGSDGALIAVMVYDGGANDEGRAVVIDANGNINVGVASEGTGTGADYLLVQYDANGNYVWEQRFDGAGKNDYPTAVEVDNTGKIVITGFIQDGTDTAKRDIVTLKYSISGQLQWQSYFNGIFNGDDRATAMAIDNNGFIYITGYTETVSSGMNLVTIQYNSSGQQQWAHEYNGPANMDDLGFAIAVDNAGNSYVTGANFSVPYLFHDFVTIKYNSQGDTVWVRRYNGSGNSNDIGLDIALDDSNNVYVTGYNFTLVNHDYATIKYRNDGTQEWVMNYNGPLNSDDGATALAIDKNQNVWVTGIANSSFGLFYPGLGANSDVATVKYGQEITPPFQIDTTILMLVEILDDSAANVNWTVSTMHTVSKYILEFALDGINYIPLDSITTDALIDIHLLDQNSIDPFAGILYSTEGGTGSFIFNHIISGYLDSFPPVKYRVKVFDNVTHRYTKEEGISRIYTKDSLGNHFSMTPPPQLFSCPPTETPPAGWIPLNTLTFSNNCCTFIFTLYINSVQQCSGSASCDNSSAPCINNPTMDCVTACDCTKDPCCCHTCAEFNICTETCKPWTPCGTPVNDSKWVVTSVISKVTPDQTICQGQSTNLNVQYNPNIAVVVWTDNSGNNLGTGYSISVTPNTTTEYCANIILFSGSTYTCCTYVKVVPATVNIPVPQPIWCGNSAQLVPDLSQIPDIASISWSPVTGLSSSSIPDPYAYPNNTTTYTIIVTDQSGCTATGSVTVTVSPIYVDIWASNASITCSTSTQLFAILPNVSVTLVWSPPDGLSNTTVPDPLAHPLSTTTYTVTATTSNGCTASDAVTITVNPPFTAYAGPDQTICPGQSTTLTASGGVTFQWSTGQSGSSISVTPNCASPCSTIYTVTVTDANGCTATDAVTVTVLSAPNPIIETSNSPITCDNNIIYSVINPQSGLTYQWSATNGIATCTPPCTTATVTWTDATQSGTIILTATNSQGCSSSSALNVTACCLPPPSSGDIVLTNTTITAFINQYGITNNTYSPVLCTPALYINGTLTIDQSFTFSFTEIKFGPDAKIVIPSGAGNIILLIFASYLHAGCGVMWDGIYVNEPDDIVYLHHQPCLPTAYYCSYQEIRDAKNAVVSNNGGRYIIHYNFRNNYKALVVNEYPSNHQGIITGSNIFTDAGGLLPPYAAQRGELGVEINSVKSIQIGLDQAGTACDPRVNIFRNLNGGIYATKSGVTIYNNKFREINGNYQMAIYADAPAPGSALFPYKTINIGGAGYKENMIDDCWYGIYLLGCQNSLVKDNDIDSTFIGVYAWTGPIKGMLVPPLNNITILQDTITAFKTNGILAEQHFTTNLKINTNYLNNLTYWNKETYGIVVFNWFPSPVWGTREIKLNKVYFASTGIGLGFSPNTNVQQNFIGLGIGNSIITNFNYYGIRDMGCNNSQISNNTIQRFSFPSDPVQAVEDYIIGISVEYSQNRLVRGNTIKYCGSGIRFEGVLTNSQMICNTFQRCWTGIRLVNAAMTDQGIPGGSTDNKWLTNIGTNRISGGITNVNTVNWYYKGTNVFTVFPKTTFGPLNFQTTGGSACSGMLTNETPQQKRERLLGPIVRNQRQFGSFMQETKFTERMYAYQTLQYDTLLQLGTPDDTTFQNFYDTVGLNGIGKINKVHELILNGDSTLAQSTNNAISINFIPEENWKTVNDVLIQIISEDKTTPYITQKAILESVACQEPSTGGEAVYSARIILNDFFPCTPSAKAGYFENEIPTFEQNENNFEENMNNGDPKGYEFSKIFPNPNNGTMQLHYYLPNGVGELFIYNIDGRKIFNYSLPNEFDALYINERALKNGIYFYEIKINSNIVIIEKLIIIR